MEYALSRDTENQEAEKLTQDQGSGDDAGSIIEREQGRLLRFIKSRVSVEADAEDILQDVLFQFINSVRIEPIERAASWLFHTAGNKIIDWYRKIKPASLDKLNESSAGEEGESFLKLEDRLNDSNDADSLFLRSVVWDMLDDALDELPENQREVFVMNEIEGKTFKEISEATGVPVNTLLSRKRYAVLYLREKFSEIYDGLPD